MKTNWLVRGLVAGACALLVVGMASPAFAQTGTLRGKVLDEAGKPVVGAEISLDFVGDRTSSFKVKSDAKGEWIQVGVNVAGGRWTITAKKDTLTARVTGIEGQLGAPVRVPDMTLKAAAAGAASAPKGKVEPSMSKEEAAARDKKRADLEAKFKGANADIAAGDYDAAILKMNEIVKDIPKCSVCSVRLGDAYLKKNDEANAEKFYLEAIEFDPANADPYKSLATLYNGQKKFDEATKMGLKANELGGTTGDPVSIYNQGIIYWNQGKIAEAQAEFEKTIKLDPKMADAHYWYGLAFVNQGKLPEAKAPLQEYLKLAPTGSHAEEAKGLLAVIK